MNTSQTQLAPLTLVFKHHPQKPVGYCCPKCGSCFLVDDNQTAQEAQASAAAHCVKSCVCGAPIDSHYVVRCRRCQDKLQVEKEKARFAAATKLQLEDYVSVLYWADHSGDLGDGYFSDIETLLDYCEDRSLDLPAYVWACKRHDLVMSADDWIRSELERQELPAEDNIDGAARSRLQDFLNVWLRELGVHGWRADFSRAVLLQPAD